MDVSLPESFRNVGIVGGHWVGGGRPLGLMELGFLASVDWARVNAACVLRTRSRAEHQTLHRVKQQGVRAVMRYVSEETKGDSGGPCSVPFSAMTANDENSITTPDR